MPPKASDNTTLYLQVPAVNGEIHAFNVLIPPDVDFRSDPEQATHVAGDIIKLMGKEFPETCSSGDARVILDINSKQRFNQLKKAGDLPEPITSAPNGAIWPTRLIIEAALVRNKKLGRPPTKQTS